MQSVLHEWAMATAYSFEQSLLDVTLHIEYVFSLLQDTVC